MLANSKTANFKGTYARLVDYTSQNAKEDAFLLGSNRYTAITENVEKIPGSPVAYRVGTNLILNYQKSKFLSNISEAMISGNKTAYNDKFLRLFWEIRNESIGNKFHLYAKGGEYRKWYGNIEFVIDWSNEAKASYRSNSSSCIIKEEYWFRKGMTYTDLISKAFSCRLLDESHLFDMAGPGILISSSNLNYIMGLFNSTVANEYLSSLGSIFHYKLNELDRIPILIDKNKGKRVESLVTVNVTTSRTDWDSFETS